MDRAAALGLWGDVLTAGVRADGPDLSARQTAILLRIYRDAGPHTVTAIAEALNLGKPAVSRAVDTLQGLGLLQRHRDEGDLRSMPVTLTAQGWTHIAELGDLILACQAPPSAAGANQDAA
ncbi:MAG: MarR family transcriptional regulator [Alphaproteobacteria bacterium]|nr:MarR family transcriptional regulator [Alphaproteobacteria bacterium]